MRYSLLVVAFALSACGASLIPGTQVQDTPQNREISDLVEAYRTALEDRSEDKLRKLVSRRYYENASTTDDNQDDYGYDKLSGEVLPKLKDNIKKVQYRIVLRRVTFDGERATAEYEYFWKFQYSEGGRTEWKAANDFNRLDFVKEDGHWKIIAGL